MSIFFYNYNGDGMKRGFTLVELLAVLIVLGFIAIIITPIMVSTINDSKKAAIIRSAEMYVKGVEFSIKNQDIIENFDPDKCTVVDFNHIRCNGSLIDVDIEKTDISSGNIYLKNDTIETADLCINNKLVEYVDDKYEIYDVGSCDNYITVNPILSGMTPVIYEDDAWQIADTSDKWYDYKNYEWANAVILTDAAKLKKVGDKLDLDTDVKAMFVWIPRYEYKIGEKEKEISVNFISKSTTEPTKDYTIHPAFTFGDDELSGIWVGKFETSTDKTSTCYTSESETNCNNTEQNPYILPNVKSLRFQTISNQFETAKKFNALVKNADSHMMKNREWGAVAYLSQSKYGKYGNPTYEGANKEIYQNKSSSFITGSSNGTPSKSSTTNPQYTYDVKLKGTGASTTGTIYGIYDMSGGSGERVMGNLNNMPKNSGFDESWFTNSSKYYDKYTVESIDLCTDKECKGYALSEIASWYGDTATFVNSNNPWFRRGGYYYSDAIAGLFNFNSIGGNISNDNSFRVVIAPSVNVE